MITTILQMGFWPNGIMLTARLVFKLAYKLQWSRQPKDNSTQAQERKIVAWWLNWPGQSLFKIQADILSTKQFRFRPDPAHEIARSVIEGALDVHHGRSTMSIYTLIHTPFFVSSFFFLWAYVPTYTDTDPQNRFGVLLVQVFWFCSMLFYFFLRCWVHQVYYCSFALHIKQSLRVELLGSSHGKGIMIFQHNNSKPMWVLSTPFPFSSFLWASVTIKIPTMYSLPLSYDLCTCYS